MALEHMSKKSPGDLTTAKEVAEQCHAPFDATARVMQIMAQNGWLRSEQGASGGYKLLTNLSAISMHDLIEIIEGPPRITKCIQLEACDIQKSCNIISPMQKLNEKLSRFYKNLSIKEVLMR